VKRRYTDGVTTIDVTTSGYRSRSEFGTIELRLSESVSVASLRALLEIFEEVYAVEGEACATFEEKIFGDANDELLIAILEIGTPNKLRVTGTMKRLLAIAMVIAALFRLPVEIADGVGKVIVSVADASEKKANANDKKLDTIHKANLMFANGELTPEQYKETTGYSPRVPANVQLAQKILPEQSISVEPEEK
jgi:hypothetical protein